MGILKSNNNKDLIATCGCHCEESIFLRIEPLDDANDTDYCFLSYMNGKFFQDQYSCWRTFKNKIKKIWSILRNKDFYYSDIILTKEDLLLLRDYIDDNIKEN